MSAATLRRDWRRRIWLSCGCTEPCRCHYRNHPTPKRVEAYAEAVALLDSLGYPAAPLAAELAALRRRGGIDRELAVAVERRWAA